MNKFTKEDHKVEMKELREEMLRQQAEVKHELVEP